VLKLARDHAEQVVAAQVRSGAWERVCRGAFVAGGDDLSGHVGALARIEAVHHRLAAPHWFSHESAALLWGLSLWRVPDVTHVRQGCHPGRRRDPAVLRHTGGLDEARCTVVAGLPVTDPVLTAVDCARSLPPLDALVVVDGALRAGADRAAVLAMLDERQGRNGTARARVVVEVADPGAESPWESATRFVLLRDGLPAPATQVSVRTRLGTFWADLGWEQWKVLLEYDGRTKYLDIATMMREKRRHDALTEAGWRVLRVTREDVFDRSGLGRRVRSWLPADVPEVRRPLLAAVR